MNTPCNPEATREATHDGSGEKRDHQYELSPLDRAVRGATRAQAGRRSALRLYRLAEAHLRGAESLERTAQHEFQRAAQAAAASPEELSAVLTEWGVHDHARSLALAELLAAALLGGRVILAQTAPKNAAGEGGQRQAEDF